MQGFASQWTMFFIQGEPQILRSMFLEKLIVAQLGNNPRLLQNKKVFCGIKKTTT
jgi:hypothetical protein